jgi:hypothetical protein
MLGAHSQTILDALTLIMDDFRPARTFPEKMNTFQQSAFLKKSGVSSRPMPEGSTKPATFAQTVGINIKKINHRENRQDAVRKTGQEVKIGS